MSDQPPCSLYRRIPCCHYKDHITQLAPVFRSLSGTIPFGSLSKLSQAVHISDSTLSHWKKLLKMDGRPSRRANAAPRRIFADLQEKTLMQRIQITYLGRGLYYCDDDFRHDALRFYEEMREQLEDGARVNPEHQCRLEELPLFKASASFIQDFGRCNRLSF